MGAREKSVVSREKQRNKATKFYETLLNEQKLPSTLVERRPKVPSHSLMVLTIAMLHAIRGDRPNTTPADLVLKAKSISDAVAAGSMIAPQSRVVLRGLFYYRPDHWRMQVRALVKAFSPDLSGALDQGEIEELKRSLKRGRNEKYLKPYPRLEESEYFEPAACQATTLIRRLWAQCDFVDSDLFQALVYGKADYAKAQLGGFIELMEFIQSNPGYGKFATPSRKNSGHPPAPAGVDPKRYLHAEIQDAWRPLAIHPEAVSHALDLINRKTRDDEDCYRENIYVKYPEIARWLVVSRQRQQSLIDFFRYGLVMI